MTDLRQSLTTAAIHSDAGWAWLEIPASAVDAVGKHLVRRFGQAQRRAGTRGGHVVICMSGDQPISMATAINLLVLRRLLAVRDHHLIAVLAEQQNLDSAVSRVVEELPLVGPGGPQYPFLAQIREQALASTHGWSAADLALAT